MALNSSSLRFSVEVAADQADKALKALTVAFNQAGAQAKISMASIGGASRAAGAEVVTLGDKVKKFAAEQRSEARAVSFFVNEISQIAPVSNNAKLALSGIGQAFVGGLGVASAIGVAVGLVASFASTMREAREEAERLAVESIKVADAYQAALEKQAIVFAGDETLRAQAQADARQADARRELAAADRALAEAEAKLADYRDDFVRVMPKQYNLETEVTNARSRQATAVTNLTTATREGENAITEIVRRHAEERTRISKQEASARAKELSGIWDSYAKGPKAPAVKDRITVNSPLGMDDDLASASRQIRNIQAAEKAQDRYNDELKRTTELYEKWGNAIADVAISLASGQMTAKEAITSIGQMILRQIISIGVQKMAAELAQRTAERPLKIGDATSDAALVGSGTAAALASNPVTAAAAVPGGIAAMNAAIAAFVPVASAATGWDVPAGGPFPAVLHSREMVLPEKYADVIRRGGSGVTLNINAFDARGADRVLANSRSAFAREMRKLQRARRG